MIVKTTDKVIKIEAITYDALSLLRDERGSFNAVVQDMMSEFAPFLWQMTIDQRDCECLPKGLEGAKIQRFNTLLGAKQAYADFQKREVERMNDDHRLPYLDEIRKRVDAEFEGETEEEFNETN